MQQECKQAEQAGEWWKTIVVDKILATKGVYSEVSEFLLIKERTCKSDHRILKLCKCIYHYEKVWKGYKSMQKEFKIYVKVYEIFMFIQEGAKHA